MPALCARIVCWSGLVYVDARLGALILALHTLPTHAFTLLVSVTCGYRVDLASTYILDYIWI